MIIAFGSTSEGKKTILNKLLSDIGIPAEILFINVTSGVSQQPLTSLETKTGSINRAQNALALAPHADFALGVEVGYHPNRLGQYSMFCWTSVLTPSNKLLSFRSQKVLLPQFHQHKLINNLDLCDYVRDYLKTYSDPLSQYIGVLIRDRTPLIEKSLESALLAFLIKN
jgi:non-canonical (house-cleaning) NTP pyrophosphatase